MSICNIDKIDRKLVAEIQKNNRISVIELCDKIGLTLATCHRRLKRIRESGIILKEMAIIDPRFSAYPLMVIIEIHLAKNRAALEEKLRSLKEISMCWAVSGPADFVAVGNFRDIYHFRNFTVTELTDNEHVKEHRSTVVVEHLRFDLEMELLERA
jgi:Lrp/AsnC family leucine-responsive transcriptional regulator